MEERRKKLKKGTVIATRKGDDGQWWQDVVVKDNAKVTKIITQRIEPPSDEGGNAGEKR